MSTISTHVLDQARGGPAAGVRVALSRKTPDGWQALAEGPTDADGRVADLASSAEPARPGTYRLRFESGAYFRGAGVETFYPHVEIVFELTEDDEHYHVPLLLGPFGYTTYRGS